MTLLTDAVVLETKERKRLALGAHDNPARPALKMARREISRQQVRLRRGEERRPAHETVVATACGHHLDGGA